MTVKYLNPFYWFHKYFSLLESWKISEAKRVHQNYIWIKVTEIDFLYDRTYKAKSANSHGEQNCLNNFYLFIYFSIRCQVTRKNTGYSPISVNVKENLLDIIIYKKIWYMSWYISVCIVYISICIVNLYTKSLIPVLFDVLVPICWFIFVWWFHFLTRLAYLFIYI